MSRSGPNLVDSRFDHDSCGVGFVATLHGRSEHEILRLALTALGRLAHRGAIAADRRAAMAWVCKPPFLATIFSASPSFLRPETALGGRHAFPAAGRRPGTTRARSASRLASPTNAEWLGWRDVPIARDVLGEIAASTRARDPSGVDDHCRRLHGDPNELEHRLFLARKAFERGGTSSYVCSLSTRTHRVQSAVRRTIAARVLS